MRHPAVLHHGTIGHHHIGIHLVRVGAIRTLLWRRTGRELLGVVVHDMLMRRLVLLLLVRRALVEAGRCLATLEGWKTGCIHDCSDMTDKAQARRKACAQKGWWCFEWLGCGMYWEGGLGQIDVKRSLFWACGWFEDKDEGARC